MAGDPTPDWMVPFSNTTTSTTLSTTGTISLGPYEPGIQYQRFEWMLPAGNYTVYVGGEKPLAEIVRELRQRIQEIKQTRQEVQGLVEELLAFLNETK